MFARSDFVKISVRRLKGETWQVHIGRLEAILSLWMATVEARAEGQRKKAESDRASKSARPTEATNWRRTKAGSVLRYRYCRILGDDSEDGVLRRDLSWWIDELTVNQSYKWAGPDNDENDNDLFDSSQHHDTSAPPEQYTQSDADMWHRSSARNEKVDLMIGFNGQKEKREYCI